jgi:outer membrane receptor protein involved in Fe transport
MNLKFYVAASQAVCAALALATLAPAANAQVVADAADTQLQEIIITAAKRETDLEKTPQAISVLNGAVQQERGETGLADLATIVPNVTFNATSNVSQIYIRGIGNTFIFAGGDPGVATYQDNAYLSDQTSTNTSMYDVERVEVLRGPQGALYGRNAVGGAINIISAKPTDTFHASVDALFGDYSRRESVGYVSGPLGFADTDARVSYQVKYVDGYTKNLLAGQPGVPDTLDDLRSNAFRVQTLTHLPGEGSLRFIFSHYLEADNGAALAVKPVPGVIYPAQAIFGDLPSADPRSTYANVGRNDISTSTFNMNYVQPLNKYTLTAIGNVRQSAHYFINDCDGTAANDCTYATQTSSHDYFGDVHVASPNEDRLRWLAGVTYLRFNQSQTNLVDFNSLLSYFVPGAPGNLPFPIDTITGGNLKTKSYAAYTELQFQLNSIWAVTGQVRYSETTKDAVQTDIIPAFGLNSTGYTGPGSHLKDSSVPFKLAVEGQLTPEALVYVSYTTAEKDGAINLGLEQALPIKKETIKSAEIGEKMTFLDRRLLVNGAIFDSDYYDLQISQIVTCCIVLSNAPKSNIKGAELEVVGVPAPGLQLSLNAGYLDAVFKKFSNGATIPGLSVGPIQNLAGNQLPNVSKVTINADAAYKFEAIPGYATSLEIQYSWHDRVYFNEFNTDLNQKPVGVLNLFASLSPEHGPWKFYGYVHNVTNETVAVGATVYSGPLGATRAISYAPPRLFGIGASYSW